MSTIALVDDDHNILSSVSVVLEAESYRVITYSDGFSALKGLSDPGQVDRRGRLSTGASDICGKRRART